MDQSSSKITTALSLFRSSRSLQREGSGVPSRKTTVAEADEARKRVSLLSPTDNLRTVTKKTNHWSVNYRAPTSMEQHTKWSAWRTIQQVGLAETNSTVVKAHSSLPPVLKSMMTQTSSSFPLDQPFRYVMFSFQILPIDSLWQHKT